MRVDEHAQEPCCLCGDPTAYTVHRRQRFIFICKACQRKVALPVIEQRDALEADYKRLCESLGYCNQADGCAGYEVPSADELAKLLIQERQDAECRSDALEARLKGQCAECDGEGWIEVTHEDFEDCTTCNGSGLVWVADVIKQRDAWKQAYIELFACLPDGAFRTRAALAAYEAARKLEEGEA